MTLNPAFYRQRLPQIHWQSDEAPLPLAVADWLLHTDSLTQKLQQICGQLQVQVTQAGWQAVDFLPTFAMADATADEDAKKDDDQPAWLREVILLGDQTPWIFAQTILPKTTIDSVAQAVPTLGDQPIGLWLFPQKPKRLRLEWGIDPETNGYARRSLLALHGQPIAIYEYFLPQFPFEPCVGKA